MTTVWHAGVAVAEPSTLTLIVRETFEDEAG